MKSPLVHVVRVRVSWFLDLVEILYDQVVKTGLETRKGRVKIQSQMAEICGAPEM